MKFTSILPVILWTFAIAIGNYQIVSSTNSKILEYKSQPPFRIGSISNPSHLNFLLDDNLDTVWEKKVKQSGDVDFFLEMKLTHFFDGTLFVPFQVRKIQWTACPGKSLPRFTAKLLLRESINVDKELRLPQDKLVLSYNFNENGKRTAIQNLTVTKDLQAQSHYPEGIFIYTLEMTLPDDLSSNDCFSEIQLKE